jgi:hypothetical protein
MNLNLLPTTPFQTRGYGTQSFRQLAEMALDDWNQVGVGDPADHLFFSIRTPTITGDPCSPDSVNEVRFAPNYCGTQWGSVIGITFFYSVNGKVVETDVIFNNATVQLDAYPGELVSEGNETVIDFVRVALHEFGHALGLGHPDQAGQSVPAVMNSIIGDDDQLRQDDIDGAHAVDWSAPSGVIALTVTRAGSGSGTVSSSPSGIDCGSTCAAEYASGTPVTLSAVAAQGSVFAGWSGGGCAGTGVCLVTLTAVTAVTATFDPAGPTFALTVTRAGAGSGTVSSTPSGIACGITCSTAFSAGAVVTLSAAALPGSQFAGWSGGGCAGTGACVVTLTADVAVTATFTPIPQGATFTLSVGLAGTGTGTVSGFPAGIVCGTMCTAVYPFGTVVVLTAAPAAGTVFAGWQGTCAGTGACLVSMTADRSVTARFEASTNLRPAITSPADGTTLSLLGPTPVAFAWTAVAGAARYFLEHSGAGLDFANPNGTTRDTVNGSGGAGGGFFVPGTSQVVVIDPATPPGRYRVRIIGVVDTGGFVGTFSDAITIVIGSAPGGGQVTILAPASGAVVARGTAVSFSWTPLPGITTYGLEFTGPDLTFANPNGTGPDPVNGFGGAGGGLLVAGPGLTVLVPADLVPGAYAVRVIGISPSGLPAGTFSDAITIVIQ